MTAFYMWRLMAMTFFGAYRGPAWEAGHGADVAVAATHGVKHPADRARARPGGEEKITRSRTARPRSASDEAGALAARVAGNVEFGGEGLEPALGGALADVKLGGDLGAGRGTAV